MRFMLSAPTPPPSPAVQSIFQTPWAIPISLAITALLLTTALTLVLLWRYRQRSLEDIEDGGAKRYVFRELKEATRGFRDQLQLSGPGQCFVGKLAEGEAVVVRRCSRPVQVRSHRQSEDDRWLISELRVLSNIQHRNVVTLLGYGFSRRKTLLLVYQCQPKGTLETLIRPRGSRDALTWMQRLHLAAGASLGLDFLHSQVTPQVLHMDVRSANVIVTEGFEGQVWGLGCCHRPKVDEWVGPDGEGSHAHQDPLLASSRSPTTKSDVYSFGIVLLEVATEFLPMDDEQQHILSRVLREAPCKDGPSSQHRFYEMMAPSLKGEIAAAAEMSARELPAHIDHDRVFYAVDEFFSLALRCCSQDPDERPSMRVVAEELEQVMLDSNPSSVMLADSMDSASTCDQTQQLKLSEMKNPLDNVFGNIELFSESAGSESPGGEASSGK